MPTAFPITVAMAVTRPQEMALAMVKSTEGPGARMIKIVAIRYSVSRLGSAFKLNMSQLYGVPTTFKLNESWMQNIGNLIPLRHFLS
jgi:hypothetical protein